MDGGNVVGGETIEADGRVHRTSPLGNGNHRITEGRVGAASPHLGICGENQDSSWAPILTDSGGSDGMGHLPYGRLPVSLVVARGEGRVVRVGRRGWVAGAGTEAGGTARLEASCGGGGDVLRRYGSISGR